MPRPPLEGQRRRLRGSARSSLRGVVFDTGSDVLKPQSQLILDSVATELANSRAQRSRSQPHRRYRQRALNLDLSRRRAEAVKAYLVGKGVRAEDLNRGPRRGLAHRAERHPNGASRTVA